MKRLIILYFLTSSLHLAGQSSCDTTRVTISPSFNLQQQNLTWSIAGNIAGQNPDVYSELEWKKIRGPQLSIDASIRILRRLRIVSSFATTQFLSGKVTDTDYQTDGRKNPSFNSTVAADRGRDVDVRVVAYYPILAKKTLRVDAGIGYTISSQNLFLTDHESLNSRYQTYWHGVNFTSVISVPINQRLFTKYSMGYNQVRYRATGHWNLMPEFRFPESFTHTAKGYGAETKLELIYLVKKKVGVGISGEYFYWSTGKGIDEVFYIDGSSQKTQLNDVTRNGISSGVSLIFLL